MERPRILHIITPHQNVSPFDVNMAYDAGFDAVMGYTNMTDLYDVGALVQDMIFSRSPAEGKRTAVFIGGKDLNMALDMYDAVKEAMVPPFKISVFPDPAGAFTTAAAMVACAEKLLKDNYDTTLEGKKVKVFGAKGIVGSIAGVICGLARAESWLVGYDGLQNVKTRADDYKARFNVETFPVDGSSDEKNTAILADADVVLCAARAGRRVLSKEQLATAPQIKVVADVNAVPPAGIEGIEPKDNGRALESGALSIGPLAIGDTKFKTERGLFKALLEADEAMDIGFGEAADFARKIVGVA
ncbi:MAG: NAD(P)-dependent methylenetetrahydromethanopterin dehydrogenase [Alphaproteobacteria bacterium]